MSAIWNLISKKKSKLSKLHKKDPILHVATTFSLKQIKGKQEQAMDPFHTP